MLMRLLKVKWRLAVKVIVIISLWFGANAFAEDVYSPDCKNLDPTEKGTDDNQKIDRVTVKIHPIFDESNPKENNYLFRAVNYLHVNTRESIIKNDLLFSENDRYEEQLLDESERILRTRRYLSEASVTASDGCSEGKEGKEVRVDVHEVWTLIPVLNFSHAGGKNSSGYGLRDSNFLGFGKTVNIKHTSDAERTGNLFQYYDPNTGIADSTFSLGYADNNDGTSKSVALIRPFVALSTEWTAGISYDALNEEDTLYNAGKEVDRFARTNTAKSIFFGIKLNTGTRESVHRILVGYNTLKDSFLSAGIEPDESTIIPEDRQFNYPWIEYQRVYDGYIKAHNIDQINRVEDINLGANIRFRLGYASSEVDAYDKSYVINSQYSQGFMLSKNQILLAQVTGNSYYGAADFYNGELKAEMSYHWKNFNRGQFFVGVTAARGFRLFKDLPLELGGDTGLRGYPARYEAGDHLQLVTLEQRFFGEKEWFSLFHMGAAVFYDQGRAWGESAVPQNEQGLLRDFGIGLRISGTRTGNREEGAHNVVHIDVATPLDGGKDISKFQWIVKVKQTF